MASADIAIDIQGITKRFRKSTISREYTTLKSELVNILLRRGKKDRSHWIEVLKGVNVSIPRGRTVGIIGRNGSGKSTLLKLINGIYSPTEGKIEVNGRISALLELGAGFHPDFSGRENITINGIILGMTRSEIRARMDEIIAFAELGDFIDEPVRTYSSGMYMRLAFAVATHVDPDILVIDEILAVGDAHFSKKSKAKMDEFKSSGKTIVLVTHDLKTVEQWCDLAVWIDGGKVRDIGDPRAVVGHYHRVIAEEEAARAATTPPPPPPRQPRTGPAYEANKRWGSFDLEITDVTLPEGAPVRPDEGMRISLAFQRFTEALAGVEFSVSLLRPDGQSLWSTRVSAPASPLPEKGALELVLHSLPVADGEYRLEVVARSPDGQVLDCRRELDRFFVRGDGGGTGAIRIAHQWSVTAPRAGEAPHLQLVSSAS